MQPFLNGPCRALTVTCVIWEMFFERHSVGAR
jgi:hypothetical protein